MNKKEIYFTKYKTRGDYHWQGISGNIFKLNLFLLARYQLITDFLPDISKKIMILDVGCGDGALSYLIKIKTEGKVIGLDSSAEAISIANEKFRIKKIKDYEFLVGSGYSLPFRNNIFDFVILADVIEHVGNPNKMLKEIRRVLKSGAQLIISTTIKKTSKPKDTLHIREYSSRELQLKISKFYNIKQNLLTHPMLMANFYQYFLNIGSYKPQPIKYIINCLKIFLSVNPFRWRIGNNFACQTIIAVKQK